MGNWWDEGFVSPVGHYGADAGWFGSFHDIERGNVYSMADGTPLTLPANATYNPDYSTQYSAVYDTADGHALSFMHIKNLLYGTTKPTPEPAGFQFAIDNHMPSNQWYTGTTIDGKRSLPMVEVDAPGTGVVELGVFDTDAHAFVRNNGGDIAPSRWPAILGAAGSGSGATPQPVKPGGNGSDPFSGWPIDPGAWGTPSTNPIYNAGAHPGDTKYYNAGLGPDPAAAVRSGAAGIADGILKDVSRLGLVALFGGAALAVLILTVKPYVS
jgi:hypothetical protein